MISYIQHSSSFLLWQMARDAKFEGAEWKRGGEGIDRIFRFKLEEREFPTVDDVRSRSAD